MRTKRRNASGGPESVAKKKRGERSKLCKQWFEAAVNGHEVAVAALLAADPTLLDEVSNAQTINDDHGATALLLAAAQSQHKVVELLLAARSSAVATDFRGRTALHYAARANSCQVVELLLAACPTLVDVSDEEGCTALLDTLHEGNNEAIINQLLAANPQKLDAMDTCGMNALHHAIRYGNASLTWWLLDMRPDLIHSSSNGLTPLHIVTKSQGHYMGPSTQNAISTKLFKMCPQAATDFEKVRLLEIAVREGDECCLDLLLPTCTFDQIVAALKTTRKSPEGVLLPFITTQCDRLLMVLNLDVFGTVCEYLFGTEQQRKKKKSSIDNRLWDDFFVPCDDPLDPDADEALKRKWFEATKNGNDKLVAQLLNEAPTLLDAVSSGSTALHFATDAGHHNVVAQLVAAKPSLVDVAHEKTGIIALHLAASRGDVTIMEILLTTNPTSGLVRNSEGRTALIEAASSGHLAAVELLLAKCPGAIDLVDREYCTALLHAFSAHHRGIVRILLAAKPENVAATGFGGWNVLHHAVFRGDMEHAEKILEIDPNLISTLTCELKTPLWLAVERGHDELIKKLFLRYPQAVHMTHERGQSPFLLAVQLQNHPVMNVFFPEMTFEELVRGYWCFSGLFEDCDTRVQSSIHAQCEDVAQVLGPALMNTVYVYLGFGTRLPYIGHNATQ